TARATLTVDDPTFGQFTTTPGTFTASGLRGGRATIRADLGGASATAKLDIHVHGAITGPGAPTNADTLFGMATEASDPARTPAIEYPASGVVLPVNLPPITFQWSTGGNDLFHLTLVNSAIALDVFVAGGQWTPGASDWDILSRSTQGSSFTFAVE